MLDAAQTLGGLRASGVGLRRYQEPWLDTTSPLGEVLYYITVAYAVGARHPAERVKAGMDRAKREGPRVGRPPVTARPGFAERWAAVRAELEAGRISRSEAARQLDCGYATLLRLLATDTPGS